MSAFPIPDFIVIGTQVNGEVILLASKTLTRTKLHEEIEYINRIYGMKYRLYDSPKYDLSITAMVKDYVIVKGKDYAEAWQTLFKTWTPTRPDREELPARKMPP